MTTDDMAQVRAALTDEVLDAAWRAGIALDITDACDAMLDVLLSALAPLVRPAPTCATCRWPERRIEERDYRHICTHPAYQDVNTGAYQMVPTKNQDGTPYGCSLHTPRPSTPEGSAR